MSLADSGYPSSSGWISPQENPQRTIMLIDDSQTVRTIIETTFKRIGIPVFAYSDGFAAIQALTRGEVPVPDLLLLDIGLPRMDGYEVARILHAKPAFSHTTIVMLSGRDGMMDRFKSKMVGARDYIRKPFRISQVVNVVCSYLHLTPPSPGDTVSGSQRM